MTVQGINEAVEMELKNTNAEDIKKRRRDFNRVFKNMQVVGNKRFACVPCELILPDERFQRCKTSSKQKINKLAREFDVLMMDPIRISTHREDCSFSVVDGFHRISAAKLRGIEDVECEILDLSDDPIERLEMETKIFLNQDANKEPLKAQQKHKANLINKTKANVVLQECLDEFKGKYDVREDKYDICGLTGFCESLRIAAQDNGKEHLEYVLNILFRAGWAMARCGLGNLAIGSTRSVLLLHWKDRDRVSNAIIDYYTNIEPEQYFAEAHAAYPERKEKERLVMYLERKVCNILGMNPVYNGGNLSGYLKKGA